MSLIFAPIARTITKMLGYQAAAKPGEMVSMIAPRSVSTDFFKWPDGSRMRQVLLDVVERTDRDDMEVLFDFLNIYEQAELVGINDDVTILARAQHRFLAEEFRTNTWGFGVNICKSRVTGEWGIEISREIGETYIDLLHTLQEFKALHIDRAIPTGVTRAYPEEGAGHIRGLHYVGCFLRVDQLNQIDLVRAMLGSIADQLRPH